MKKKILFISCGKVHGNTWQAAGVAARAAEEAGADVMLVEAIRLNGIGRGCIGCMACQKSAEYGCALDDEVADLILEMPKFDMVVFCTPVYFFSFSAQAKGVIDRLMAMIKYDGEVFRSPLKGKNFALLATSGGNEADSGIKALRMSYRYMVDYFQGKDCGELYFPDCDANGGGLENDIDMPSKARIFGKKLAAQLINNL